MTGAGAARFLVTEHAPSRTVPCATEGGSSRTYVLETEGVFLPSEQQAPEAVAERFAAIVTKASA